MDCTSNSDWCRTSDGTVESELDAIRDRLHMLAVALRKHGRPDLAKIIVGRVTPALWTVEKELVNRDPVPGVDLQCR